MHFEKTEKQKQLNELAQQTFLEGERDVQPLYPWIAVIVLPKERQLGSIILPEKQNKVLYEGIVVRTFVPCTKLVKCYADRKAFRTLQSVEDKDYHWKEIYVQPRVEVGDLVIFPHWEGIPVPWLDEHFCRLIREECCVGQVAYRDLPVSNEFRDTLKASEGSTFDEVVKLVQSKFFVVPRDVNANKLFQNKG